MTSVLNRLDQAQLEHSYIKLPRPVIVPSESLIGIHTMSSRKKDCLSAEELTAIPSHRSYLQSLYTWEEDTNHLSLVSRAL